MTSSPHGAEIPVSSTAHIVSNYGCLHVTVLEKCLNFVRKTLYQIIALLEATPDGTKTWKCMHLHVKERKLVPKKYQDSDMASNYGVAKI